ncbi:MAG TPA: NAD-dependent epimerase/dehydratase family protein [Candidatus Woesebacteria bacterium]|nr:NAD-dependent epimerase/dehydratase family protein [Candidatus Woesebacteria bacterium]
MNPQPLRIIVTGGSGFLGHHLIRTFVQAGHQVRNIDLRPNPEFETALADVRDQNKMNELITDADVVFHLASLIEAGESVKESAKYFDNNVMGTLSVLEAMRRNQIKRFIFSSSAAIYGEPLRTPILEDDRTLPINPYGVTKLAMEGLLRSYVESYSFTGMALRYFNLYGPEEHHQPESHAIPRFISQIIQNQEVTLWGDGGHLRDYVYIHDIVDAHLLALDYAIDHPNQYHYFNLSAEQPASVLEVIKHLENSLNKKANIKHFPDRPGDPRVLIADATKAHQQLGWHAATTLSEGLKKTVQYFTSL